ncbi:MAG: hypothetical protein IPO00_07430, partial [Betaproteobacteria bacterium]|nr:hypothetical protein [Betaproteobacteria bacterium]
MSELRKRMHDAMLLRGFSERPVRLYLRCVSALAKHYGRSRTPSIPPPSSLPAAPDHREETGLRQRQSGRLCHPLSPLG